MFIDCTMPGGTQPGTYWAACFFTAMAFGPRTTDIKPTETTDMADKLAAIESVVPGPLGSAALHRKRRVANLAPARPAAQVKRFFIMWAAELELEREERLRDTDVEAGAERELRRIAGVGLTGSSVVGSGVAGTSGVSGAAGGTASGSGCGSGCGVAGVTGVSEAAGGTTSGRGFGEGGACARPFFLPFFFPIK